MKDLPVGLPECGEFDELFPVAWKEAYYRAHFDRSVGGYVCPDCRKVFKGTAGFRLLHGDHVIPRSLGGKTVWENLALRCGPCNYTKSNRLISLKTQTIN